MNESAKLVVRLKRRIRVLLHFFCELVLLWVGFVFSWIIGIMAASAVDDETAGVVGFPVVLGCHCVTLWAWFAFRRNTASWEIELEADAWVRGEAERRLNPVRAKYKRLAKRIMIWAPSLIAAFVLFFLPWATHLVHPSSRYLPHYRIPIPWSYSVFLSAYQDYRNGFVNSFVLAYSTIPNGRFGATLFWTPAQVRSRMDFAEVGTEEGWRERRLQDVSKEIRLSGTVLRCWQYEMESRAFGFWDIDCGTTASARWHFYASFRGSKGEISTFYKILEGVTLVE